MFLSKLTVQLILQFVNSNVRNHCLHVNTREMHHRTLFALSYLRIVQKVRMVLVSRSGSERVREFETRVRRDGEVVKSWTRFSHPSDVAGTQLVLIDHPDQSDEQLLYLPALQLLDQLFAPSTTG